MDKIRVGRNSIAQSRDQNRDHSFTITINDDLHLHFSFEFSEIWIENGVKPSLSYPVTNPETARELMLDFRFIDKSMVEQWFDYLDDPAQMQNEADGYLYVDKTKYDTDELIESGRLVFQNGYLQIEIKDSP